MSREERNREKLAQRAPDRRVGCKWCRQEGLKQSFQGAPRGFKFFLLYCGGGGGGDKVMALKCSGNEVTRVEDLK